MAGDSSTPISRALLTIASYEERNKRQIGIINRLLNGESSADVIAGLEEELAGLRVEIALLKEGS